MEQRLIHTIIEIIKQKLLNDGYVIIPSVGGFFVEMISAQYDDRQNVFFPPRCYVRFNQRINQNDGELIVLLSKFLKVSFFEATKYIEEFSRLWKYKLSYNKEFELENFGRFKQNSDRIEFILYDSTFANSLFYGLKPVSLIKEQVDRSIIFSFPERKQEILRHLIKAAIFIPLVLTFSLLPTKINYYNSEQIGANIFNKYETLAHQESGNLEQTIDSLTKLNVALMPNNQIVTNNKSDSSKIQLADDLKEENKNIKQISKRYYIIIASFTNQKQVNDFISSQKDLQNDLTVLDCEGRLRIAYKSFATRDEANIELQKLKINFSNINGWILYW
ncbi:MAG: SPOR domain-containing protein [Bacteroidales bacterium]|nr:SPOR domain-containing protein [Bacteroidales bacterium]